MSSARMTMMLGRGGGAGKQGTAATAPAVASLRKSLRWIKESFCHVAGPPTTNVARALCPPRRHCRRRAPTSRLSEDVFPTNFIDSKKFKSWCGFAHGGDYARCRLKDGRGSSGRAAGVAVGRRPVGGEHSLHGGGALQE